MGGLTAERTARLCLTQLAEPGDERLGQLVADEGGLAVVQRITDNDPTLVNVENYRARLGKAGSELLAEYLRAVDGRFVIPGDSEWPTQLEALGRATPLGLYVAGADLRLAALRSVAIVGSRAATQYGVHVASEIASDLADRQWTVVSGGAYGIDAAAHRGSLSSGGQTIAVLACGVDMPYPPGNASLLERIKDAGGVLVSELPPQAHPTRPRFLKRNRVIAALARATIVVEAANRSGALNTASYARSLGRQLLAVPGPVTSGMSAGCHRLIRDDEPARLVTGADEIIEEVGPIGALAPAPSIAARVRDSLDPLARLILEAFPAGRSAQPYEIAREAGLGIAVVPGVLLRLAAAGLIEQREDGGFRLVWGAGDATSHS